MKRLLLCLLMLCLLTLGSTGLAEEPATLPSVGDTVHGFTVREIREAPFVGAQILLFEHEATGAHLMYIANADTNRVFDLTFLTRPIDNTGLPHVFEHATLGGSEKYPSKSLFFNLSYQTYNTFMNAMTMSMLTTYPVASLSEAQLLKYADFYTDSCLHPMIMTDESIYREEAWRYRMGSMDEDLTMEGTVYSEMLGAMTLERSASQNAYRAAFPGSFVGYNFGGDPESIPDMTWESLKSYHDLYYHPSNVIAYLYGQFDHYEDFLQLLDEAFAGYEKRTFTHEDPDYTPITEPVEATFAYATESGSSTEHKSSVYYEMVLPGLKGNTDDTRALSTLASLLDQSSSPLMQALSNALPYGTFTVNLDETTPDTAMVFAAETVNGEDAATFRDIVDSTMKDIAANGLNPDVVDGLAANLELDMQLYSEDSDVGVNLIQNLAYTYAYSGDAYEFLNYVDALFNVQAWNADGTYARVVSDYLVDCKTTALVSTVPAPGEKEKIDAALAEQLAAIKAGMSEEELQAIIDSTNASDEEPANTDMINALTAVNVDSLPEEARMYELHDTTNEDGIRLVDAVASVDGVAQTSIYLDASGLSQDQIHWFMLYTDLLGELDTDQHTKEEMDVLLQRYLYQCEIRPALLNQDDGFKVYLKSAFISQDQDLEAAYNTLEEVLFRTQFTNSTKLLEKIQAQKTSLRSTINSTAYNIMVYRAAAVNNPLYRYYNYQHFLEYYDFLCAVEEAMQSAPDAVIASLTELQSQLRNNTNAICLSAGNEASIEANHAAALAFLAKLNHEPVEAVTYDLPVPASREALIIDSNVQYNILLASMDDVGLTAYDAKLDAISNLISDLYLLPMLRDQYGVYGAYCQAADEIGLFMFSYRDPNIVETFDVYDSIPGQFDGMNVDQETLNGYILSAYSGYARSDGELTGATTAALNLLDGHPQEEKLAHMRELKSLTAETFAASADMFRSLVDHGIRSTAGGASAIQAHADLYDVILNPFNAVDSSSVEFTDVTEEGAYDYSAVRFIYENGLMAPKSEDTFGVEDPASVGDFLGALYAMLGGTPNAPEEALEALSGAGLVAADTDLNAPLTEQQLCDLLTAVGVPGMTTDTPDATMTRGDLAELLYSMMDPGAAEQPAA